MPSTTEDLFNAAWEAMRQAVRECARLGECTNAEIVRGVIDELDDNPDLLSDQEQHDMFAEPTPRARTLEAPDAMFQVVGSVIYDPDSDKYVQYVPPMRCPIKYLRPKDLPL